MSSSEKREHRFRKKNGKVVIVELLALIANRVVSFVDVIPKDIFPCNEDILKSEEFQDFGSFVEELSRKLIAESTGVPCGDLRAKFLPSAYQVYVCNEKVNYPR